MSITTVRLQPDVKKDLDALADKLHRSRNWLVNEAVREFVARQDLEASRWQETLAAMEAVAQGHAVSGDAVQAWLESWGSGAELPPPKTVR